MPSRSFGERQVWINAPTKTARQDAPGTTIVTPDDRQHGVIEGPTDVLVEDRRLEIVSCVGSVQ